jgi:hypothetical protein
VNGRRGGEDLAVLIERSAELKRDLVDFACSPRWERSLAAAMAEAGLEEIDEGDAISTIDRFTLQYRLPDGQTVMDRFMASRPDLEAADREMLLGWRDPVEGIFEIRTLMVRFCAWRPFGIIDCEEHAGGDEWRRCLARVAAGNRARGRH